MKHNKNTTGPANTLRGMLSRAGAVKALVVALNSAVDHDESSALILSDLRDLLIKEHYNPETQRFLGMILSHSRSCRTK